MMQPSESFRAEQRVNEVNEQQHGSDACDDVVHFVLQLSAISYQLSAISYQRYQLSAGREPPAKRSADNLADS
jgi:hypothetical protein